MAHQQSIKSGILEEWKPVPDFHGYEVSNLGEVRSYRTTSPAGKQRTTPILRKTVLTKDKKYLQISIANHAGAVTYSVHTLVLLAFVGPKPTNQHECCHKDGDGTNNQLANLRWGLPISNAADRILHGTQIRGETCNLSVLTETQVKEIKQALPVWKRGFGKQFAQKFGVCESVISAIKHGHTWVHI